MTLFAWLIGLALPACAAAGAQGLPAPVLIDMSRIQRPDSPNTALAAPAGFSPTPDIVTPVFRVQAARLYAAVRAVALGQARVFVAAEYPVEWQIHFVARSAVFNFPDLVTIQAAEAGPESSTIVLYSRSVYGYGDFGANRQRLQSWLDALLTTLNHTVER
jgi:uncharacterized protein (DUF1499 family)